MEQRGHTPNSKGLRPIDRERRLSLFNMMIPQPRTTINKEDQTLGFGLQMIINFNELPDFPFNFIFSFRIFHVYEQ